MVAPFADYAFNSCLTGYYVGYNVGVLTESVALSLLPMSTEQKVETIRRGIIRQNFALISTWSVAADVSKRVIREHYPQHLRLFQNIKYLLSCTVYLTLIGSSIISLSLE